MNQTKLPFKSKTNSKGKVDTIDKKYTRGCNLVQKRLSSDHSSHNGESLDTSDKITRQKTDQDKPDASRDIETSIDAKRQVDC